MSEAKADKTLLNSLLRALEPDARSLLAFRVILALSLFFDLLQRFLEAPYFYTETGILPRALWGTLYGAEPYYWSLHLLAGETWLVRGVLLAQLALALCLLIGYKTRWVCLLSWVLLLSLVLRNPLLHYGADKLAPLLLLIAAFLPLSNRSLSSRARRGALPGSTAQTFITRLAFWWLLMQMAVLYIASGRSKLLGQYWQNGTALENVLDMNMLVRPLGVWFADFEGLLRLMTWAVPWAEIVLPLLFFVPLWRGRVRTFAVLGLLGLNLGIQTMLDVGYFMFYATVGLVALLPGSFWDDFSRLTGLSGRASASSASVPPFLKRSVPTPTGLRTRLTGLGAAVVLGLMAITLTTGLEGMGFIKVTYPPGSWTLIRGLNMYQNWGLFTDPAPVAYWYVAKARLKDGSWVDILQDGGPVTWAYQRRPNVLFARHSRWRAATTAVGSEAVDGLRPAFGRALEQRWNDRQPPDREVAELTLYLFSQPLPIVGESGRTWQVWLEPD